jgi:hypothetical protein
MLPVETEAGRAPAAATAPTDAVPEPGDPIAVGDAGYDSPPTSWLRHQGLPLGLIAAGLLIVLTAMYLGSHGAAAPGLPVIDTATPVRSAADVADASPATDAGEPADPFDRPEALRPLPEARPPIVMPALITREPPSISRPSWTVVAGLGRAEEAAQARAAALVARVAPAAAPLEEPVARQLLPDPPPGVPAAGRGGPLQRLHAYTDEELRRHLLLAPEVSVRAHPLAGGELLRFGVLAAPHGKFDVPPALLNRPDLHGLPFIRGDACRLGKEPAENLQVLSVKLHAFLAKATEVARRRLVLDPRPDPVEMRRLLLDERDRHYWLVAEAVPTLQQMLMAENKPLRLILVEALAQIPGKAASRALAQRAVFDLNPEVREAAVEALRPRPRGDYDEFLLTGLGYPWAPAAVHAAEAIVALDLKELAPLILNELEQGDPALPYVKPGSDVPYVREVVRIHHLTNCMLCHPPSFHPADPVRAISHAQPSGGGGYGGRAGVNTVFIRADVTYLKQDFSAFQPVPRKGLNPEQQRFDYLLRERPATDAERRPPEGMSVQSAAALFARDRLLGKSGPGPKVAELK